MVRSKPGNETGNVDIPKMALPLADARNRGRRGSGLPLTDPDLPVGTQDYRVQTQLSVAVAGKHRLVRTNPASGYPAKGPPFRIDLIIHSSFEHGRISIGSRLQSEGLGVE